MELSLNELTQRHDYYNEHNLMSLLLHSILMFICVVITPTIPKKGTSYLEW
jgi:hypothetical protein